MVYEAAGEQTIEVSLVLVDASAPLSKDMSLRRSMDVVLYFLFSSEA